MVLKLDLIKAYDRVDWDFIRLVLLQIGIPLPTTNWIMGCVSSANFSILVNGNPTPFFSASRGLRQGCPMSPLLFLLIAEGFSRMIKELADHGDIVGIEVAARIFITHLLFVDDILLFGGGTFREWQAIKKALDVFCDASGMRISPDKSQFYHSKWEPDELEVLHQLFSFDIRPLEHGFRYLGFFLKPNDYKIRDWCWLLKRIESRIGVWGHRFLSIGGRLILTKSVLESIPVFWFSLIWIPKAVLKGIQSRLTRFIWSGCSDKSSICLARWDLLAKPKDCGGWGLKDIGAFGRALNAKNLWRCLFVPCLWHRVVSAKYLRGWAIGEWIRLVEYDKMNISSVWRALLKAMPILKQWVAWRPGDGWSIRVGRDPILGLTELFRLSDPLLTKLLDNRVYYLAQVAIFTDGDSFTRWADARDLNLTRDLANEWSDYTYKLKNTGLSLNRCKDSLFWSKNVKTGTISAALAYKSSVPSTFSECIPLWFKEVWRWNIPLKTVLFSWLMLAERILTWNMLQKKGFAGPGICPLCHDAEESITHLMIKCSFSVQVWQHIGHFFETELLWHGLNITEAFRNWITGGDELRTIPFHMCRFI